MGNGTQPTIFDLQPVELPTEHPAKVQPTPSEASRSVLPGSRRHRHEEHVESNPNLRAAQHIPPRTTNFHCPKCGVAVEVGVKVREARHLPCRAYLAETA